MLSWRSARSRDFMCVVMEVAKEQTGSSRAPLHQMRRFQARDEPASGSMGKEFPLVSSSRPDNKRARARNLKA